MGLVLTITINLTFSEMAKSLLPCARLAAFYLCKKVYRYRRKHHRIFLEAHPISDSYLNLNDPLSEKVLINYN